MPDRSADTPASPAELAEILAELEFFLHLDEAEALPLEEDGEDTDEP